MTIINNRESNQPDVSRESTKQPSSPGKERLDSKVESAVDPLFSNRDEVLSNIDLTSYIFFSIAFRKNGSPDPFLAKLAIVNTVFRYVVMKRCKQELSGEEIGNFLVKEATRGNVSALKLLINCNNLNEVSDYRFGEALLIAARKGMIDLIEDLKGCSQFENIFAEGNFGLGHALSIAAKNGHLNAIEAIKSCQKSKDIPADWLGLALKYAAKEGNVDVIKALSHPNLKKISPDGEFGLEIAFFVAAQNGHVNVIKAIKTHPNYNNIPADGPYGLGAALVAAAENGQVGVIKELMSHPNFNKIPAKGRHGLERALTLAVQNANVDAMKEIKSCGKINPLREFFNFMTRK